MTRGRRKPDSDPRQMSLWDWAEPAAPRPEQRPSRKSAVARSRSLAGGTNNLGGLAAELRVAQDYERRGFPIARQRWRGKGGEIDLIARDGDGLVFVEVKKSRSFDRALQHLSRRQMSRLLLAAEEYLGSQELGTLTNVRFDIALVDSYGRMEVIENVLFDA